MSTTYLTTSAIYPYGLKLLAPPPPPADRSSYSVEPWTIFLSANNFEPQVIELYAQNSQSHPLPVDETNKWGHLVPHWRFTDVNGNVIRSIIPTASSIIYNGSTAIGMVASAQFYYVDDMPSKQDGTPIIIWATLNVSNFAVSGDISTCGDGLSGFTNSKIIVASPYYINGIGADHFGITRNGKDPLNSYYWTNIHIPHFITVNGYRPSDFWCPYNDYELDPILFEAPASNVEGIQGGSLVRNIIGIPVSSQTWTPNNSSCFLSAFDDKFRDIGGFIKSDVYSCTSITSAVLFVSGNVLHDPTYRFNTYIWVANPNNNILHRFYVPYISDTAYTNILSFIESEKLENIHRKELRFDTPLLTSISGFAGDMSLSGFGGIYGIAIDPCYNVWATDPEMDRLYKFNYTGNMVSALNFKTMPAILSADSSVSAYDVGLTPAGISLDRHGGIWVSFFDSVSVVKLGIDGDVDKIVNIGNFVPVGDPYSTPYTDNGLKPTLAETDCNDNIWVSYTNTLCSMLVQFDSNGNRINGMTITLPTCSNPMDVLVDSSNNVWVSLTYHSGPGFNEGAVRKYNTHTNPPTLLSSIDSLHPEYLTMNLSGDLAFTFSERSVQVIQENGSQFNFVVGPSSDVPWAEEYEYNHLEGIAFDSFNRLYVINSYNNVMYVYNADYTPYYSVTMNPSALPLLPNADLEWYNDSSYITASAHITNKSAQAFGDWTGIRWQIKYSNFGAITGVSNPVDILDFDNYNIRRFNESWNAAEQIQGYAIAPHINQNPVLWEQLLGAPWGTNAIDDKGFGRPAYEKIANYVQNHSDVETSNIPQLYSLSQETDVPIDNYNLEFPPELKRIMDIISINQQTLWGSRCNCQLNITNKYQTMLSGTDIVEIDRFCIRCGHYHPGNHGEMFDAETYVVSAYVPFVVRDVYEGGKYVLITPPLTADGQLLQDVYTYVFPSSYTIAGYDNNAVPVYDSWGVVKPRFCFFDYVKVGCNTQIAGVINWDDPYTTLIEQISSIVDWYEKDKTVEKILNYVLHNNLGFKADC